MIFVTVGTNEAPFDRLLRAIDELRIDEELIVQHGSSTVRPAGAFCVESLPLAELTELVCRARVVITHAGVGTILTALANGTRPVVVPRLRCHGEAVDDHQVEFARRLQAELITLVEDMSDLPSALCIPADRDSIDIAPDLRLIEDLKHMLGAATQPEPTPIAVPAQTL
jgi:UDP-N-acetylglucosamine transferase subunit ALG13